MPGKPCQPIPVEIGDLSKKIQNTELASCANLCIKLLPKMQEWFQREMLILEGVKSTSPSQLHSNYPTYEICTALNVWNWCEKTSTIVACDLWFVKWKWSSSKEIKNGLNHSKYFVSTHDENNNWLLLRPKSVLVQYTHECHT